MLKVYLNSLYLTNFRKSTTTKKIKFLKKYPVFHKSQVKFSNLSWPPPPRALPYSPRFIYIIVYDLGCRCIKLFWDVDISNWFGMSIHQICSSYNWKPKQTIISEDPYDLEGVLEAAKLDSRNRPNDSSPLLFTLPKEDFVRYLHLSRKKKERLTAICQMFKYELCLRYLKLFA